jgi:hypothetical protein
MSKAKCKAKQRLHDIGSLLGIFGIWDYVMDMGMSTHGFTHVFVGIGADLGFNATTTHQQNPNYQPFQQHL